MNFLVSLSKGILFETLKLSGWKKNVLRENLDYIYPEIPVFQ